MSDLEQREAGIPGQAPLIGIAPDVYEARPGSVRAQVPLTYSRAIVAAGGFPVILAPDPALIEAQVRRCDGLVLVGGDDPSTEPFGRPTDPRVDPVHPVRQAYELALLGAIDRSRPTLPTLGVCLGMQYMALHAGGTLNQWMPDSVPTAGAHWGDHRHEIRPTTGDMRWRGEVTSHHRQAIDDPGRLVTFATAPDGVIEAIGDPARAFYVGVQWHPERTDDPALGSSLFEWLVETARSMRGVEA